MVGTFRAATFISPVGDGGNMAFALSFFNFVGNFSCQNAVRCFGRSVTGWRLASQRSWATFVAVSRSSRCSASLMVLKAWLSAARAAEALTDACLCERAQQAANFFGAAKLEAACAEQLMLRPEFEAEHGGAHSDADGWIVVEATELEAQRWPHEEASQRRFRRRQCDAEQARAAAWRSEARD